MNIQAGRAYGAQSMAAPLKRVLMRSAAKLAYEEAQAAIDLVGAEAPR